MHTMGMGVGGLLLLLLWLIGAAILFGVVYAAVRLGVLHALKSHTHWLQSGQSTGPRPAPPAPPAPQAPAAPQAPPQTPPGPPEA
jgi:hypothetical protein